MRRLHYQWIPFPSHLSHLPLLVPETEVLISLSVYHTSCSQHSTSTVLLQRSRPYGPRIHLCRPRRGTSSACPTSAAARAASPTTGAGYFFLATPCQGRTGGVVWGRGALVLALTGVAYLQSRTGGIISATLHIWFQRGFLRMAVNST
jgi:hypothetical protein